MTFATSTEPFTKLEISEYLKELDRSGDVEEELSKAQKTLILLHKPAEVARKFPGATPETVKLMVSKYTQIFRVLLGYREQKRLEKTEVVLRIRVPDRIEY